MEYDFTYDDFGQPVAKFSMGAEAIGAWFTDELGGDIQRIKALITHVSLAEARHISLYDMQGKEFQLRITPEEAEVFSMSLELDMDDELPEDTQIYTEEQYAGCGLVDFKQALQAWLAFVAPNEAL